MHIHEHTWRIEPPQLDSLLQRFGGLRLGLLGDLFLDRYLEIDPQLEELSIETGLPALQVVRVRNAPGAMGTVLNNLAALGAGVLAPVTVIGDDGHGFDLLHQLRRLNVDCGAILRSHSTMTPTYTKPLVQEGSGFRELSRLDVRSRGPLDAKDRAVVVEMLQATFCERDAWVVLDQVADPQCGVVHPQVREALLELVGRHPEIPVLIDSRSQLASFTAGILKGNRQEVMSATGIATERCPSAALAQIHQGARRAAFCTDGGQGVWVIDQAGQIHHVPGAPVRSPLDIVGAGDAVSSGVILALAAGASPPLAAQLGNLVASITVQKLGETGVATPAELRAALLA